MLKIWKFGISRKDIDDLVGLPMPIGAQVLSVGEQDGTVCLWALVNPTKPQEQRLFRIIGTGHPADDVVGMEFIGTVLLLNGKLVLHVFDARNTQ